MLQCDAMFFTSKDYGDYNQWWVGGSKQKHHNDVLRGNMNMGVAP